MKACTPELCTVPLHSGGILKSGRGPVKKLTTLHAGYAPATFKFVPAPLLVGEITCAGETIAGVSSVTGASEALRYVGTSCKLTASSVNSQRIHLHLLFFIARQQTDGRY